jgi:hypothetical protein
MRRTLITMAALAALSLGAGVAHGDTHTITVDATALTATANSVWGLGSLGADRIETFTSVAAGDYVYASNSASPTFIFTVKTDGTIDSASLPSYASASGGTLTVSGFAFTVDATQLSPQTMSVWGHGALGSDRIEVFTACPGGMTYAFSNFAKFAFSLDSTGKVDYASGLDGFLDGAGTTTLEVEGYAMTIDAEGLDDTYTWGIPGFGQFATTPPVTLRMIPGGYVVSHRVFTEQFTFEVDGNGKFQELPATFKGEVVSGTGTSTLRIGVSFDIDVLQPINADGSSIFREGRTIPVKVELRDDAGALVADADVHLRVFKLSTAVLGTAEEIDPVASGAANTGDLFRYEAVDQQYVYNLRTKDFGPGTYRLEFVTEGATWGSVLVSLR